MNQHENQIGNLLAYLVSGLIIIGVLIFLEWYAELFRTVFPKNIADRIIDASTPDELITLVEIGFDNSKLTDGMIKIAQNKLGSFEADGYNPELLLELKAVIEYAQGYSHATERYLQMCHDINPDRRFVSNLGRSWESQQPNNTSAHSKTE